MRTRFLSVLFGLTVACSSSSTPSGEDTPTPLPPPSADGGPSPSTPPTVDGPLAFAPCPLHSEGQGPEAACATAMVPLVRTAPNGETITVFVKRYRPAGGKGLRQLWMLQGGPGGSGYGYEAIVEAIGAKFPDVDFYLPDHRGTGRSTRISCPAESPTSPGGIFITQEEWPACRDAAVAALGPKLAAYDTTNAANDLGLLMARARTEGQPQFVYGSSYGTYWAQRYLQLFPQQAAGVVLDSVVVPGLSLARQDADADEAAKDFFAVCAKDAFCSEKFGAGVDPWSVAQALVAKLKAGHCPSIALPSLPSNVLFRRTFGQLLMHPELRQYIPAIVYRANRCAPNDVAALKVLFTGADQEPAPDEQLKQWGWILSNNIAFGELWEEPSPTPAELEAIRDRAVASRDVTVGFDIHIGKWPVYPKDEFTLRWADTETPMLLLQGGLDPATLLRKSRPAKEHFAKKNQTWVEVPSATHGVILSSTTTEHRSCGTRMVMNFLEAPTSPVDTSCTGQLVPLDFRGDAAVANAIFGTADAWE